MTHSKPVNILFCVFLITPRIDCRLTITHENVHSNSIPDDLKYFLQEYAASKSLKQQQRTVSHQSVHCMSIH